MIFKITIILKHILCLLCIAAYDEDTSCVGFARLGSEDQMIVAGTMRQLRTVNFGEPLHCLVIVGKTHPVEEEMLEFYKITTENPEQKGNGIVWIFLLVWIHRLLFLSNSISSLAFIWFRMILVHVCGLRPIYSLVFIYIFDAWKWKWNTFWTVLYQFRLICNTFFSYLFSRGVLAFLLLNNL